MSVIASFTVSAGEFILGEAISGSSATSVRLDRVVPLHGRFIPYLWVSEESVSAIEDNLRNEADIESFSIIDSRDGESLLRVEWAEEVDGLLQALDTNDGTVLEGTGEENVWRLRVRFDDHDRLSAFFEHCADHGINLELEAIHDPDSHGPHQVEPRLSQIQRETLELALAEGYFEIPRRITLNELADQLNVSDSAVSQRLRRGVEALLEDMDLASEEPDALSQK